MSSRRVRPLRAFLLQLCIHMKREPQNPSGFRDLLPQQAYNREKMVRKIIEAYRRFGFLPLETPEIEFVDTLIDDVSDFNLFYVNASKERKGGDEDKAQLGLRFDLTVPLARVVAQYGNALPTPFKRYQFGNVFRGERPQKGRYRQFAQLDADIVGAQSLIADTEIILMIAVVMHVLGVPGYNVRVNTRTLLNSLPSYAKFDKEMLRDVLIVLDKNDKISKEDMSKELSGLGLSEDAVEKLVNFVAIKGTPSNVVEELEKLLGDSEDAKAGLSELKEIAQNLSNSKSDVVENISFDMSVIRGLAYYTGPVFETTLTDLPEFGSICSGGRYDNLVEKFTNNNMPAVGVSVGVDRLYAGLEELGVAQELSIEGSYLVIPLEKEFESFALSVAGKIRNAGNTAEVYAGKSKPLGKLFDYAQERGVQNVIVVGENEMESKTLIVKSVDGGEEREVSFDELG